MKKTELNVEYFQGTPKTGSWIRYEWFGLKKQIRRTRRVVSLDEE